MTGQTRKEMRERAAKWAKDSLFDDAEAVGIEMFHFAAGEVARALQSKISAINDQYRTMAAQPYSEAQNAACTALENAMLVLRNA